MSRHFALPLVFALFSLACAKSTPAVAPSPLPAEEATPELETESEPETGSSRQADPSPPPPAVAVPPLAEGGHAALEARVNAELMENLRDEYEQGVGRPTLTRLGHVDTPRGTFVSYSFRAEVSDGMRVGDVTWLAVACPVGSTHQVSYLEIGAAMTEPGAESTLRWDAFEGPTFTAGLPRATLLVTTGYAEFDTCDSCSARREEALVQTRRELICAWATDFEEWSCALLPLGLRVERSGRSVAEDGSVNPETHMGPDPAPYEIELSVAAEGRVTLTLASGAAPEGLQSLLGEHGALEVVELAP